MRAHTSFRFSRPLVLIAMVGVVLLGLRPAVAADDPYMNQQWNLTQIHATSAWSVSTGSGVKVGIVDSGVNRNHEELSGQVVDAVTCVGTNGTESGCQPGGDDVDGHGTHVSGIVAAAAGNGRGIAGVAPNAQIVMARVFAPGTNGQTPTATLADVQAGIRYLVKVAHVKIVNLSIGAEQQNQGLSLCGVNNSCQSPLKSVVEEAWSLGALPVIASGNSDLYGSNGYGNLDAIVVGATGLDGTKAAYSTATGNAKWAMVAPGGDPANSDDRGRMVLSTYAASTCDPPSGPSCYAYLAGTSMSAPHVSAVAAMLFAKGLNRQAVVDTLLSTTDPVAGCNAATCGAGRLNAAKAVGASDSKAPATTGATVPTTAPRATAKSSATTNAAVAPTTSASSFGFGSVTTQPTTSTTFRIPRAAIVLRQQPPTNNAVPLSVGLVGVACLAAAALALSYNLRKTLTTLP